MPLSANTSPAGPPAIDMAELPIVRPTKPVLIWMLRSMAAGWSLPLFGLSALVFLPWVVGAGLVIAKPQGVWMFVSLLPAALLSSLGVLMAVRSVAMHLGCDRRRPAWRERAFVSRFRRSAAATGLSMAVVATLVFILLRLWLGLPAAWALASAFWWWSVAVCLSATAADDSDTIDSIQRFLVFHLHHPLTAIAASGPVFLLAIGIASLGWVASAGTVALIAACLLSTVVVSLLLASAQGAYMALRYEADRHDPAELLGSGAEWGVLRTIEAGDE